MTPSKRWDLNTVSAASPESASCTENPTSVRNCLRLDQKSSDTRWEGAPKRGTALAGTDNLPFTSLQSLVNFDYNQDGLTNAQDYTDLKSAIIQLTQRYYAPFDLTVEVAPALDTTSSTTYRNGVVADLNARGSTLQPLPRLP